jgi:cytochrome c oxidase cbb3-type subunit 3
MEKLVKNFIIQKRQLWIILLVSSSCFQQTPDKSIDFDDLSDFNVSQFKVVREDAKLIATTQKLYSRHCNSCHGYKAGGLVGPNLTDKSWIHGKGSTQDIYKILRYGIPSKGMRAFEKTLSDKELMAMSLYIKSLEGINPPGAKKPEGTGY